MKKTFRRTLRVKMLIVVVCGLVLSVLAFFAGVFVLNKYISDVYMSDANVQRRSMKQIQSFAAYVTSHSMKATDTRALRAWQEQHDNIYMLVYNNNDIIFDSQWMVEKRGAYKYVITNSDTGETVILIQDNYGTIRKIRRQSGSSATYKKSDSAEAGTDTEYDSTDSGESSLYEEDVQEANYDFYPVLFKDGVFDVCIVDYSDDTLIEVGRVVIFVLCCMMFIGIIIYYFGREISRMRRLTNQVMDIKNVDINGPITVKGQDEIRFLAENIDTMRETIIEQLSREREAWQANSDLVTAMAHDIRTPLTVMAGYLELMKNKEYSSQEELDEYIRISSEKAEQLRMMSDKMFRYFYVYSKGGDDLNMETFQVGPFLDQMLGEYVVLLGENGYQFNINISDKEAEISVDVQGMKRITDNVFTNIRKYSDKTKPIDVRVYVDARKVRVFFRNYVSAESGKAESTHIGTLTCQKMAEEMNGSFVTCRKGRLYEATLTLPNVLYDDNAAIPTQGLTALLSSGRYSATDGQGHDHRREKK